LTVDQLAAEFPKARKYAMNYLRAKGNSIEDSEDAVQSAALQAMRHRDQFNGTSAFSTWFLRIAINERLMVKRSRTINRLLAAEQIDTIQIAAPDDPERAASKRERVQQIVDVALTLSPKRRKYFLLTHAEMIPVDMKNTAKRSLHGARALIREQLCSSPQPSATAAI
jgi:RNA polymerase sigma factor (sigma-70 family)